MFNLIENSRFMQYVAALTATIAPISCGLLFTWPSPTLPLLVSEESPLGDPLSDEDASWITSVTLLVSFPAMLMAGWLFDKFGRKYCLLASSIPICACWIIVIFAKSFLALLMARSVAGFGLGLIMVGCPIYTSEISDSDIRGRLGSTMILMVMFGSFIALTVGPFTSYTVLAIICLSVPITFGILFLFMPESPYYLVKNDRIEEAKIVLVRISPNNKDSKFFEKKLKEIRTSIEEDKSNKSNVTDLFTVPEYRKALIITLGLKTLETFSGNIAIQPYLQTIIEASDTSIEPEISSIIFGFISLPSALLATSLIDKLGRKPLLLMSALGCGISLIAEGVYFYMRNTLGSDVSQISWLPTTALVLFLFMNFLGVTTVPYVITGEIFATNVKGMAGSVAAFYAAVLAFFLVKFFKPLSNQIGIYSMFWFFAASCILGALFVFLVVPETKGKTFAEIQMNLKNTRFKDAS